MFCLIDFSILSVNCSHVCIIYVKIYEKLSSGGLEVSLSIHISLQSKKKVSFAFQISRGILISIELFRLTVLDMSNKTSFISIDIIH